MDQLVDMCPGGNLGLYSPAADECDVCKETQSDEDKDVKKMLRGGWHLRVSSVENKFYFCI